MEKKTSCLIGFSANSEVITVFDRLTQLEKAPLEDMDCFIGGTSANVAKAISLLNDDVAIKNVFFTGAGKSFRTFCLKFALESYPIPYLDLCVLEESHAAFIPIDGISQEAVFGKKGDFIENRIPDALQTLQKEDGQWRIATAIRPPEISFVRCMLDEKNKGYRFLNPRMELIQNKDAFIEALTYTDALIINDKEWHECTRYKEFNSMTDLQKYGPSLIVVTESAKGGKYILNHKIREKFTAYTGYQNGGKIFKTGAGDWFHAALVAHLMKIGKPIHALTKEEISEAIEFARKVSGKKVTMKGSNNGPSLADL